MSLPPSTSSEASKDSEMSTDNSNVTNEGSQNRHSDNSQLMPVANMSMVLCEKPDNEKSSENTQDCKPPSNLQELLKLSMSLQSKPEGQKNCDDHQIDKEKATFLKEALAHFTVDVVDEIRKLVDVLGEIGTKPATDIEKYESALETIIDQVCCLDMAIVFYQIGGLDVIVPLLKHKQVSFRWMAANVIAECCQNNPYCQKLSMADNVFSPLMELASKDSDNNIRFRSISAISAIVRGNSEAIKQFCKYNGFVMLQNALNSGNERIAAKTSFLIMGLCDTEETIKDDLVGAGIVETLTSLSRLSDGLSAEHFLRALLSIARNHDGAIRECRRKELGLTDYLVRIIKEKRSDEAFQELVECAEELLKLINNR